MSGIVTDYLLKTVAKQIEDHSLVVWYDSNGIYSSAVDALKVPGTKILRFDGSFVELRHWIEPLMNGLEPPRVVIYVPVDRAATHNALIEFEAAGVVLQPGQQPPNRNTRLSIVARNALRPILGEETASEVERQVEAGALSLADVNALAEKGEGISRGVVSLIFRTGNPQEVALAFLGGDQFDGEIDRKSAVQELLDLLRESFDATIPEGSPLPDARRRLARHVLLTDLITGVGRDIPHQLESAEIAKSPAAVDACVALARTWRLRRDLRERYVAAANRVEEEYSINQLSLQPDRLPEIETFRALELMLMRHVESRLLDAADADLLDLAQSRLSRFWPDVTPSLQARWALIAAAAAVLLKADRAAQALKKPPTTIPALIKAYTEGASPWCLLDTRHRHMESRWSNFEPDGSAECEMLEKLIRKAERRYTEVGSTMARHFVARFQKAKHPVAGMLRQVEVFETQVKPKLAEGKTAYIWVDALRFEMARELCEVLKADFTTSLQPAIATVPTITEIGMAALLPGAGQGAKVVSVGDGKLGLEIDGKVIKDRKDRIAFLKDRAGVSVFDVKLDELLPKPPKKLREGMEKADLIVITSQEIDELCEQDNITQARRQMDGVLNDLRRGVRLLSDLGVRSIILAADHGHIFADEISEDMKIDPPGGETADLHRRVWVGVGGAGEPSYLRTPLAALGVESDLDMATPWDLACFRSKGGARAYFHGGLSPQELIIPVVAMSPTAQALAGPPTGIGWTLVPGTAKLTTRFFSVAISGTKTGLFEVEAPKVRVEIRAKGKCISVPVSASYGYEDATGEVALKLSEEDSKRIEPNTVTVMIVEEVSQKTVGLYLLDAASGAELASLDKIEVAISM